MLLRGSQKPAFQVSGRRVFCFRWPNGPAAYQKLSLSSVFGYGEWLTGTYDRNQTTWRKYGKGSEVMVPQNTFTFVDEHPDSINDAQLATSCTGNSHRIRPVPRIW